MADDITKGKDKNQISTFKKNRDIVFKYFLLIAVIVVVTIFSIAQPCFRSTDNLLDIIRAASIIGFMGIGLTYVMIAGEFDFSIGSMSTFAAVIVGRLLASSDFNSFILAAIIAIIIACFFGFINSINVIKIGIPAFIATLGLSTLLEGVTKFTTGGGVFFAMNWPESFVVIGQGLLFKIIPIPAVLFVIAFLIAFIHSEKTRSGRYLSAVGANKTAALNIGINVNKMKTIAFILSAFYAGCGGIIQGSMLGSITPGMGMGNLLPAISTAMLGSTFIKPGIPNIPGTALGAILLAVIANGLTMIGASFFMKDIIQGLILLIAVGIIAIVREQPLSGVSM
jgi:ribose/xylose/arabinose/galactoside ABC-type transport system permease subunit